MIIDNHVHLFSRKVVQNVSGKTTMVKRLHLHTEGAQERTGVESLLQHMQKANVHACLLLPTAAAEGVSRANERSRQTVKEIPGLLTAGTLHPRYPDNKNEIETFKQHGVCGIKMCSFSQGFALNAPETLALFDLIREQNRRRDRSFFVVLDTFYEAHTYFGTNPDYTTTPERLGNLVRQFPGVPFIAAHMGGLRAPFEEICTHLPPAQNLFLDTSNAAHTLRRDEFIHLLKTHGAGHVIFGTDWPWFDPAAEIPSISGLLDEAGCSPKEKEAVLGGNMARLLGI